MAALNHPPIYTMPNELMREVVELILETGHEEDAVNLMKTNQFFYNRATTYLYRYVVRNNTFHLLGWAAEHGRLDTLQLAINNGADPNQIITSTQGFHAQAPGTYWRQPGGIYRPLSHEQVIDSVALVETSHKQMDLVQCRSGLHKKQWYVGNLFVLKHLGTMKMTTGHFNHWANHQYKFEGFQHGNNEPISEMSALYKEFELLCGFTSWTTPLHIASAKGNQSIVLELLKEGAKVNSTSLGACTHANGKDLVVTPLHSALCNSQYDVAELLVKHGATHIQVTENQLKPNSLLPQAELADTSARSLLHEVIEDATDSQPRVEFIHFLLRNGYSHLDLDDKGRTVPGFFSAFVQAQQDVIALAQAEIDRLRAS